MVKHTGRVTAVIILAALLLYQAATVSSTRAQASTPYNFTVKAFCLVTGSELSVPIWMDEGWTEFSTPHTFVGLTGNHTINVPPEDSHGHFVNPYSPPSEGILVGNGSFTSLHFNYTHSPSVRHVPFDSNFSPGSSITISTLIGVADQTVSVVNVTLVGPKTNYLHPPAPLYHDLFTVTGWIFDVSFEIPYVTPIGDYTLRTSGDTGFSRWVIEVSCRVQPPAIPFPPFEDLPHVTTFRIEDVEYRYYQNPSSDRVVIFIGQGLFYELIGSTSVQGPPSVGDENSATYRLVYDLTMNGFSVVSPSTDWSGVDFPAKVVDYLKKQGKSEFYIIGWSAGGVVAANAIINNTSLFRKAVIADAVLTSATADSLTNLAPKADSVTIPHYLIWGEADTTTSIKEAEAWLLNARPDLAKLGVFEYFHDSGGTPAELQIRDLIITFLSGKPLIPQTAVLGNTSYTFYARTNAKLSDLSYDGQRINVHVGETSPGSGQQSIYYTVRPDVFIVPKTMLRGDVTIMIDEQPANETKLENSTHHFFYFELPAGEHTLTLTGSEPIPEFNPILVATVASLIALSLSKRRQSPASTR